MVQRGGCSFVRKSLNIQKVGGKVAVVVDNVDENEENVIMIDMNNQGDRIYIPTYMISQRDGKILRDAFDDGQSVVIKSSLEIESYSFKSEEGKPWVPYQLWYSGVYDFDFEEFDLNEIEDVYK